MKLKSFFVLALLLMQSVLLKAQTDSLSIKIGQMILIGFPTTKVDSSVLKEIAMGKVGAIIVFEKNIPPQNSFAGIKKITWTYQKAAPIPLLIGIDQEGGRVNRLKTKYGFPTSITAAEMGKGNSIDSVRFYGESTASTLAGLGFNINFAPVVDLASNPTNPIIAKIGRAFSANEDTVIWMAKEFIKQHRKYGVLTSLKHFPGHGSSKDDTHKGIADVTSTWEQRELKPYQSLIDSGYADAVMTSHIVNKKLDPTGNPGTLSADIITGILRQRLHFNGVVFTDDMQMHAITKYYGFEEAIRLTIKAGVDIMTFSNNIAGSDERTVDKVQEIVKDLIKRGEISEARIDESYRRIMTLKNKLQQQDRTAYYEKELLEKEQEIEVLKEQLAEAKKPMPAPVQQTEPTKKKKRKKN